MCKDYMEQKREMTASDGAVLTLFGVLDGRVILIETIGMMCYLIWLLVNSANFGLSRGKVCVFKLC